MDYLSLAMERSRGQIYLARSALLSPPLCDSLSLAMERSGGQIYLARSALLSPPLDGLFVTRNGAQRWANLLRPWWPIHLYDRPAPAIHPRPRPRQQGFAQLLHSICHSSLIGKKYTALVNHEPSVGDNHPHTPPIGRIHQVVDRVQQRPPLG